ncbi:hypothetical protein CRG98_032351 [Punica granatum]|uniref:Uncharacterized protein n=1 Tax=Punica granatum TaxID=22663 RepID=A0A2I0ITD4_PUNGR|nr:hypothetical protein CRG98_032351 [Punica granatum]
MACRVAINHFAGWRVAQWTPPVRTTVSMKSKRITHCQLRSRWPSSRTWACDPSGGIKVMEHGLSIIGFVPSVGLTVPQPNVGCVPSANAGTLPALMPSVVALLELVSHSSASSNVAPLECKAKISDPIGVLSSWNSSISFCRYVVTCGRKNQRVTISDLQSDPEKLSGTVDWKPELPQVLDVHNNMKSAIYFRGCGVYMLVNYNLFVCIASIFCRKRGAKATDSDHNRINGSKDGDLKVMAGTSAVISSSGDDGNAGDSGDDGDGGCGDCGGCGCCDD